MQFFEFVETTRSTNAYTSRGRPGLRGSRAHPVFSITMSEFVEIVQKLENVPSVSVDYPFYFLAILITESLMSCPGRVHASW